MNKFNLRDKVKINGSDAIFEIHGVQIVLLGDKAESYYRMKSHACWHPETEISAYVEPKPEPKFKVGDKVRLEGNDKVFEVSGISVDKFLDGQDAIRYYLLNEWPLVKGVNERDLTLYAEPKFKVGDIVNNINSNNTGFYTVKEIFARENTWRYHLEYQCGSWQTNADEDQIVLYIEPKFKIGDPVYRASRELTTKVFDVDFEDGRYLYTIGGILFSQKAADHELELIPKAKFKVGDSVYWDHDKSTSKVTMVQWNQLEKRYRYQIGGGHTLHAEDHLEARPDPKPEPKFKVGDAVYCRKYDMTTNVEAVQRKPFNEFYRYEIGKMYLADEDELVPIPKAKFKVGEQVRWERYSTTSNVEAVKWDQDYGCYYYSICKIHLVAEDHLESVSAKAAREGFELAQKVAPFLKIDWALPLASMIAVKPQEDGDDK